MNVKARKTSRMTSRESGAISSVTSWRERLSAWARNHRQVAVDSARRMTANLFPSFMTWTVIGIAFALPAWLYLVLINMSDISGHWSGQARISVYLGEGVTASAARIINQDIAIMAGIRRSRYISPEEALDDFQKSSGLSDIMRGLPANPLPGTILVFPESSIVSDIRRMTAGLRDLKGVDRVNVDLMWVERLHNILELGRRVVLALTLLLGAAVVLVIGNTIRLMIENRRAEIEVIKLVGATDGFVRRPFLYTGIWYGLGGGLTALLLVQVSMFWIGGPFSRLLGLYSSQHHFSGLGFKGHMLILFVSMLLGLIGAWLAVNRHLNDIEPN